VLRAAGRERVRIVAGERGKDTGEPAWRLPGGLREQVPGVLDRYQRRTMRLAGQAGQP
jgi:hypothetical protein